MESVQPFSPSSKSSSSTITAVPEKLRPEPGNQTPHSFSRETSNQWPAPPMAAGGPEEGFIGSLDVFVHHARDIHNICIYHKQDVYAKLCLTSDPDAAVSTQTINGGGRNPVFNQGVRLNVRTVDSTLKCEIWMLSRVKNYLEDQLLGFALVPLPDVVVAANGKLVQEFSLSSTDLFHSPAGFVQLSLSYAGSSPEVMAIAPPPPKSAIPDAAAAAAAASPDAEGGEVVIPREYEKIEFPDLKTMKEDQQMVSEYFGIPCSNLDEQSSESLISSESGTCADDEAGVRVVESFSTDNSSHSTGVMMKNDTPVSSVSTTESPTVLPAVSQSISDPSVAAESPDQKEKSAEATEGEADSSGVQSDAAVVKPIIKIDIPEQTVVQQDIVDMYMKSMQQFTESLAKMKLPMDLENSNSTTENGNTAENGDSAENGNSGSEKKLPAASKGNSSRVFYGSRAFF